MTKKNISSKSLHVLFVLEKNNQNKTVITEEYSNMF